MIVAHTHSTGRLSFPPLDWANGSKHTTQVVAVSACPMVGRRPSDPRCGYGAGADSLKLDAIPLLFGDCLIAPHSRKCTRSGGCQGRTPQSIQ